MEIKHHRGKRRDSGAPSEAHVTPALKRQEYPGARIDHCTRRRDEGYSAEVQAAAHQGRDLVSDRPGNKPQHGDLKVRLELRSTEKFRQRPHQRQHRRDQHGGCDQTDGEIRSDLLGGQIFPLDQIGASAKGPDRLCERKRGSSQDGNPIIGRSQESRHDEGGRKVDDHHHIPTKTRQHEGPPNSRHQPNRSPGDRAGPPKAEYTSQDIHSSIADAASDTVR